MEQLILKSDVKSHIYVCLARSFDTGVVKDRISHGTHLVCSTYCTNNYLKPYSFLDEEIGYKLKQKKIILKISNSEELLHERIDFINKGVDYNNKIYEGEYLDVYNVNILELLYNYNDTKTLSYLVEIVGHIDSIRKDSNAESEVFLSDMIFHFENFSWFSILIIFKLFKVQLSGGSNNRRHILSSVHHNLSTFLFLNGITDCKSIYDSFKNPILQINSKIISKPDLYSIDLNYESNLTNNNENLTEKLILSDKKILSFYLINQIKFNLNKIKNNVTNNKGVSNIELEAHSKVERYNLELDELFNSKKNQKNIEKRAKILYKLIDENKEKILQEKSKHSNFNNLNSRLLDLLEKIKFNDLDIAELKEIYFDAFHNFDSKSSIFRIQRLSTLTRKIEDIEKKKNWQ